MEHSVCYTFILLRLHMIIMLKNITEKRTSYTHTCTENTDICANRNSFKISHGSSFCFFSFDHPHFHFVRLFLRKKNDIHTWPFYKNHTYTHTSHTITTQISCAIFTYDVCLYSLIHVCTTCIYVSFIFFFFCKVHHGAYIHNNITRRRNSFCK